MVPITDKYGRPSLPIKRNKKLKIKRKVIKNNYKEKKEKTKQKHNKSFLKKKQQTTTTTNGEQKNFKMYIGPLLPK